VKVVRNQTIKCPPLTESVQEWFDLLWSFDHDSALNLYAKNFEIFKAEEFERSLTSFGIDRGRYKGGWDHIVWNMIETERPNDRPLPGAFPQFSKCKIGKYHMGLKAWDTNRFAGFCTDWTSLRLGGITLIL